MKKPLALDLFCGAGGVSAGLVAAGFDVIGVDIEPQPEYPYPFIQADALKHLDKLNGFLVALARGADIVTDIPDFIWASPPCQRYSQATRKKEEHPDLIEPVRKLLKKTGKPYIIENVIGAPLIDPVMLCGAMFDLGVVRHRLFESSFKIEQPPHPKHKGSLVTGEYVTVAGNGGVPVWTLREREKRGMPRHIPGEMSLERWQQAMGINWMSRSTLTQAIPPAYSEFLGKLAIKECPR